MEVAPGLSSHCQFIATILFAMFVVDTFAEQKHNLMKLKTILLIGVVAAVSTQANAQSWTLDTLTMGPGYANDVYYDIENGVKTEVSNADWDLAFSAIITMSNPHYGVGAWVNEATNDASSRVVLYSLNKGGDDFHLITSADTLGKTTVQLHNSVTTYASGAFNANATTHPDYGWGTYSGNGVIVGDSVFLAIKNTVAYKIMIKKYNGSSPITWEFYAALLDGSAPTDTITIDIGTGFQHRLFAYYSLTTKQILDREPNVNAWDFNLTRYMAPIAMGPGMTAYYPSTGVLSNPFVSVAEVRNIADAGTLNYANYIAHLDAPDATDIDVIGRDWKKSTFSNDAYDLDTVTYFVRSRSGAIHQIEFLYSSTSATGVTALRKRTPQATNIDDVNIPVSTWMLAPNPANGHTSVTLDAKENTSARVLITDVTGKTIQQYPVELRHGLNAYKMDVSGLASGLYIITVTNGNWKLTERLVIQN